MFPVHHYFIILADIELLGLHCGLSQYPKRRSQCDFARREHVYWFSLRRFCHCWSLCSILRKNSIVPSGVCVFVCLVTTLDYIINDLNSFSVSIGVNSILSVQANPLDHLWESDGRAKYLSHASVVSAQYVVNGMRNNSTFSTFITSIHFESYSAWLELPCSAWDFTRSVRRMFKAEIW